MAINTDLSYAVVFTYSFDDEVAVYLFATEEEATRFLRDQYHEELRVDIEESGWNTEGENSDDWWYAKISNNFDDGDARIDVTEMRIGRVYE